MKKIKFTVDSDDRGWADSFNQWNGSHFKINEIYPESECNLEAADVFNHAVAGGPAISFVEI